MKLDYSTKKPILRAIGYTAFILQLSLFMKKNKGLNWRHSNIYVGIFI